MKKVIEKIDKYKNLGILDFSDLEPHTTYTFYQRFKGDANTEPSDSSQSAFSTSQIDLSNAQINVQESVTYNGKAQTPAVQVYIGVDEVDPQMYKVLYENNTNAGTAKVIVTALNTKYTGSKEETFTIEKAKLTPSISGTTSKIYDGNTTSDGTGLSINFDGIISGDCDSNICL